MNLPLPVLLVLVLVVMLAAAPLLWAARRWGGASLPMLAHDGRRGEPVDVVATDGTALHAEVDGRAGAEFAVVLVHDVFGNVTHWNGTRQRLADAATLVLADLRGHGMSGAGSRPIDMPLLVEDLAQVVDATTGSARVILVGHGLGAQVAVEYAATGALGDRLAGVVACGAAAAPPGPVTPFGLPAALAFLRPLLRNRPAAAVGLVGRLAGLAGSAPWLLAARMVAVHPSAAKDVVRRAAATAADTKRQAGSDALRLTLSHDLRPALGALAGVPTVVIAGRGDRFVPFQAQLALRSAAGGGRHIPLDHSGHALPLEHPGVVADQVRALLRRSGARPTVAAETPPPAADPAPGSGLLRARPDTGGGLLRARPDGQSGLLRGRDS